MTVSTIDYPSLFRSLSEGTTLVTGNHRLARVLAGQYSQWRMNRGDRQWRSPAMYSWDAWLDRLWEQAELDGSVADGRAVPGGQQLISLWQRVLRDDSRARLLLRPESLATRLRDTRRLAVEWRLDFGHAAWSGDSNENHGAFRQWNRAFEALCREEGWIPPEDRTAQLCRIFEQANPGAGPGPDVGLVGFDEFSPAQQALLESMSGAGYSIRLFEIARADAGARLWKSRDGRDELQQMARWVRHWFETEPGSRIAVVVPDLQARRSDIERHLARILAPGRPESGGARPWNVSMGVPLARVPMIESAFAVLRLLDIRAGIQDIGSVLRSPWIRGGASERNSRALLEKCLRDNYPRQVRLTEVRYRSEEMKKHGRDRQELLPDQQHPQAWNSPVFRRQLGMLIRFEKDERSARAPSAWSEAFDGLLSQLGWPRLSEPAGDEGNREQGEAWQAYQAWQDALRELASLDATVPKLGRKAAIGQLLQLCRERIFQPRTQPASIQVLGLYEASGLRFDHLWVTGLHNDNWPPAAQPNPFIPGVLQQKAQLPHSSPQRELDVARAVTRRLLESAEDCVFSYPGRIDGEDVLPSPLLDENTVTPVEKVEGWSGDDWQHTVAQAEPPRLESLEPPGPPRFETARGGSSILRHQALCPFRAFASNRLGAEGMMAPVDGVSASLHGSLVHRALERFWAETRTHAALTALDENALAERVLQHVRRVVDEERSFIDRPEFRDVEGKRLARLVLASLELEKARDPFEVVGFEQEVLQDIEGQPVRLYIDRIDRLAGGGEVIIDYKTGRVDPKKWFGDRPDDPQLPLYAISAAGTPAAVAFAVIRDDECLYRGVATREGIFPGLPPVPNAHNHDLVAAGQDMESTIGDWRRTLHRLMSQFLAGEAAVDPKNGRPTCANSYCELQALCRIDELEQRAKLDSGVEPV